MNKTFLFLILTGAALAAPAHAVSVGDLPNLVRRNNQDVAAAEHDVAAANHAHDASYGRLFPKLDLKASATRLNDDIIIDIGPKKIERNLLGDRLSVALEVDPPPVKVQDKDVFNAHLLATQPLFAGGRIKAGIDAASAQLEEAQLNLAKTQDDKLVEALDRYFKARLAEHAVRILDRAHTDLTRIEAISRAAVESGMAAKFSTLSISVALAELEARQADTKAKRDLSRLALKNALGLSMTTPLELESELIQVPLQEGLDVYKTQALNKRREFAILGAKANQVEALKQAKTGEMLPTAYLFGKRELLTDELTMLQPKWAVGIGVDIPLTAGLTNLPERRQAAEMRSKVSALQEKARFEIPLQVEAYYAAVTSGAAEIKALAAAQKMAQEALRLAEVRFKAGSGSTVEVLKAQADLESTEIKRWLALESYNRNLIALYNASGSAADYVTAYARAASAKPRAAVQPPRPVSALGEKES